MRYAPATRYPRGPRAGTPHRAVGRHHAAILALAAPALATGIAGLLGLGLLVAAALSHAGEALSWQSLTADDQPRSWTLPPSGELYRVCECAQPDPHGERVCYCTEPRAAVDDTLRAPIALDIQRRGDLPVSAPVPRARLRYAGEPVPAHQD